MVRGCDGRREDRHETHRTVKFWPFPTTVMEDVLHTDVGTGKYLLFGTIGRPVAILAISIIVIIIVLDAVGGISAFGPRLRVLVLGSATTTPG